MSAFLRPRFNHLSHAPLLTLKDTTTLIAFVYSFFERCSADGDKLLVGTAGCEIFELSATDGSILHGLTGPFIAGHGRYSPVTAAVTNSSSVDDIIDVNVPATALAVHPSKREYATAGAAGRVRTWDAETR